MDSLGQIGQNFISDVYSYGNTGSSIANGVSASAQQKQMNFNSEEAELAYQRQIEMAQMQAAYNSAAAAEQRAYNEEMWGKQVQANREAMEAQQAFNHAEAILAREFNAAEAEKGRQWSSDEAEKQRVFNKAEAALAREFSHNEASALRDWQERMSNTQYQRAVKDMQAAGINPILAAGASAGNLSGAMGSATSASGAMASSGIASGPTATSGLANSSMASSGMQSMSQGNIGSASAGNYTGQGNNMSESLALMGAVASMFGSGMSGLAEAIGAIGENLDLAKAAQEIGSQLDKILGKVQKGDGKGTAETWGDGKFTLSDLGLETTGWGLGGFLDALFNGRKRWQYNGRDGSGGGAGTSF